MSLKKCRFVRIVVGVTIAVGWSGVSVRGADVPSAGGGTDLLGTQVDCASDNDCGDFGPVSYCSLSGAGGTCYVPATRYLAIAPNLGNGITARRISLDIDGDGAFDPFVDHVLGWVDQPFATVVAGPEPSPQAQARVSAVAVYRDWNDLTDVDSSFIGAVSVKVGDCEIAPVGAAPATIGNVYFIQAITEGSPEGDESSYSSPLMLRTTARYADSVGDGNYPNNGVNLLDAFAAVLGFQGIQQAPKWRVKMTGGQSKDNIPDFATVSLIDVFDIVTSKQSGGAYLYEQPCDCPGQECP